MTERRAGLLVPLFSLPSTSSWGIGDFGDLAPITRWLAGGGQSVLQLLPLNEMATGQQSPYSALSAMAIDPIYICVSDLPEFAAAGGEAALSGEHRALLTQARESPRIDYATVRRIKESALTASFDAFYDGHWRPATSRAGELRAFIQAQDWWIADYALYRALHARHGNQAWTEWPDALKRRDARALEQARQELARDVLFYEYLQWTANRQWLAARRAAGEARVALFGDLPFMVDGDSADVWARPEQFHLDASVGVPPDAFSATGQDWGMPVYNWEAMAADGFRWLSDRARRSADLFDGYRVDHLVGFYRTYARPRDGREPFFTPALEENQRQLGERVLGIFRESGAEIVAEDLGTVPDFVRASLAQLDVPGFRVFRWERHWHMPGQPFREPAEYPAVSVALSGTHDTETQAVWWSQADGDERHAVSGLPTIQRITGGAGIDVPFSSLVRDTLLEALFASGSNLLLCAVQDVFGWSDRINEPATVADANWTFRLPWPVDRLDEVSEAGDRQAALRRWAERYGRWPHAR